MARTAGFRIVRVQTEPPGLGGSRTAALPYKGVLLGYTLCVPTLAGPISAKIGRHKFGSGWPFGPPEVLTKEDQRAPYQTAPQSSFED